MSQAFWPAIFLAIGLLLIILEVFIPSGGFVGICSIGCLILCLWHAFQVSTFMGATFMLIELVALPVTASVAFSLWSRSPLGRKMFLAPPTEEELVDPRQGRRLESLIGEVGRAVTPLRPCGHVEFSGHRVDALAEEGFVPENSQVKAIKVRSGQLVVRGLFDSSSQSVGQSTRSDDEKALPIERNSVVINPSAETVSLIEEAP
jgi:membrane-bound ClpP family serine protease